MTVRDKERRKRRGTPLLVPGFCLPRALSPVLPIYLQGVLQVGRGVYVWWGVGTQQHPFDTACCPCLPCIAMTDQ